MSANNGVIRIGRKGIKKFAFGDDGNAFEVDVVVAFQEWIGIDEGFRDDSKDVPNEAMPAYHQAALDFVQRISGDTNITTAEALDFIARLREQYDELASFFRPRLSEKHVLPDTSEAELRFSVEAN